MSEDETPVDVTGDELADTLDTEHGFHLEEGFKVDAVVGVLQIPVVICHSNRNPEPKERAVMELPDGSFRVHDFVSVGRANGKQVVFDRWSLSHYEKSRILTFAARLIKLMDEKMYARILKVLDRLPF